MSGRKRSVRFSQQEIDRIMVSEADDPTAWGKVTKVEPKRRRLNQRVVLLRDLPKQRLRAGDVGTIVERHPASGKTPAAYEVEFFAANGETVAVVSVPMDAVRPATHRDLLSSRVLSPA
jgi:hypothetical protein